MKKWIPRAALVLIILLVLGLVAAFLFLNTLVKSGVEKIGPIVTKTEVKLDSANLSPFSGKGELHGLFVGNPEGYKTPSAIKVKDIKVNLDIKSVTSDVVLVQSIVIEAPEITFEGGFSGSNLRKLLDNISAVAAMDKSKSTTGKPAEGGKRLKVESLLIKNAKVNISFTGMMGKSATVAISDIHLTNIGMDENGISTAELSRQVIKVVLQEVIKVIPRAVGKLGGSVKDIGAGTAGGAETTVKGIKKLFKKREVPAR
ncbi:MAG: hypothetical protein H0X66_17705 [Verrucomicrobia bacterium]|nr:hypothetical protein [Verrucomicrobiota bacterium]